MKKVISMMMALAMTLALAIPAFASSITISGSGLASSGQYSFTMGADTKVPTVNVYVPAASNEKLVLNPYGLKYTLNSQDFTTQVISSPVWLGSFSDVPLLIDMKVAATTEGNAVLSNKSLAEDTKTKTNSVFIWGQVLPAGTSANIPATLPTFASSYDAAESSMILVKSGESTKAGICTIPACDIATGAAANNQWACVKFFGDAVQAPTNQWTGSDKVNLVLTFTFTPSMVPAA